MVTILFRNEIPEMVAGMDLREERKELRPAQVEKISGQAGIFL